MVRAILQRGIVNFWITNRLPRRLLTSLVGRFARVENKLVAKWSIAAWRLFADDLNLKEARKDTFTSLHDCFTRELKDGARPIDSDDKTIASPCDAVVVASGRINDGMLFQAKGRTYSLDDLLRDSTLAGEYRDGCYATLRLKSSMYHRFHAPYDCCVNRVEYIPGDLWNVNPPALERVERLYCKNERAVLPLRLAMQDHPTLTLVPVGAILVGSIHLNFVDTLLNQHYKGPSRIDCNTFFTKGEEMGRFEHGSTIIVLASSGFALHSRVTTGVIVRMGQALLTRGGD